MIQVLFQNSLTSLEQVNRIFLITAVKLTSWYFRLLKPRPVTTVQPQSRRRQYTHKQKDTTMIQNLQKQIAALIQSMGYCLLLHGLEQAKIQRQ